MTSRWQAPLIAKALAKRHWNFTKATSTGLDVSTLASGSSSSPTSPSAKIDLISCLSFLGRRFSVASISSCSEELRFQGTQLRVRVSTASLTKARNANDGECSAWSEQFAWVIVQKLTFQFFSFCSCESSANWSSNRRFWGRRAT